MKALITFSIALFTSMSTVAHEGHGEGLEGIWHYLATPEHAALLVLIAILAIAYPRIKRLCMRR